MPHYPLRTCLPSLDCSQNLVCSSEMILAPVTLPRRLARPPLHYSDQRMPTSGDPGAQWRGICAPPMVTSTDFR